MKSNLLKAILLYSAVVIPLYAQTPPPRVYLTSIETSYRPEGSCKGFTFTGTPWMRSFKLVLSLDFLRGSAARAKGEWTVESVVASNTGTHRHTYINHQGFRDSGNHATSTTGHLYFDLVSTNSFAEPSKLQQLTICIDPSLRQKYLLKTDSYVEFF